MLTKWLAILLVGWVLRHGYFASQLGTPDFTKDSWTEGWEWSNGGWWSCGDSFVGGLAHGFTKTGWTGSKPEYVTYVSIYMQNIRICKPLLVCICILFISRFHIMVSWMIRMNMNMFLWILWMLWNHWVDSQAFSLCTCHIALGFGEVAKGVENFEELRDSSDVTSFLIQLLRGDFSKRWRIHGWTFWMQWSSVPTWNCHMWVAWILLRLSVYCFFLSGSREPNTGGE